MKLVAEKYGDFAKVIVALEAYGSLEEVHRLTESQKKELEQTNRLLEPAKQQLKAQRDLEEASKKLLESYQELQRNLRDAITRMPNDLTTALNEVADEFKKSIDEELKKLSKDLSESASKELNETTKNLTALKEQFKNSKQELSTTIESTVKAAIENVNSVKTKGSDTVESFQKQSDSVLQSLNSQLIEMKRNFEIDQEAVAAATAESIRKVNELASHAVETGKKLNQLEKTYDEYSPYLELTYLAGKQHFPSITPRLLSTMKVVLRGFVLWLNTSPAFVKYPQCLGDSCKKFLQDLDAEVPEV